MEWLGRSPSSRQALPGQPMVANGEMQGRTPTMQPAGRRAPVSHHMSLGAGMVPEAMGYSPALPDGDFGRGWQGHGKLELPLSEVVPQQAPQFTPFRGQHRPGARSSFGGANSSNAFDSQRSFGGYSIANATQAPESTRSYVSAWSTTPPASQRRASHEPTPRSAPGRASPVPAGGYGPNGTPPVSQRRVGSYSTTSRGIGAEVGGYCGSHFDSQALPQPTTDRFKHAVGGVVPGYGGHVPNAPTHCGNSHVGGVMHGRVNSQPPSQREQRGHGEGATRMGQRTAAEVAGGVATHVAAASIPGYKGHVPGSEVGAFGQSNWSGVQQYGFGASPVSSNAHHARSRPFAGESPTRMANLEDFWA